MDENRIVAANDQVRAAGVSPGAPLPLPAPEELSPAGGESRGTDYSQLPHYPDLGPELPPRKKTDWLWEVAETFAGTLIGGAGVGLVGLVCALIAGVRVLLEGGDPLEVLRGVGIGTLACALCGAAFGLYVDARRAAYRHIRGD